MVSIKGICVGEAAEAPKEQVDEVTFSQDRGIEGDLTEDGIVKVVCFDEHRKLRRGGSLVKLGAFAENLVLDGVDSDQLREGMRLSFGTVVLEIAKIDARTSLGTERRGSLYVPHVMASARVLAGGKASVGDPVRVS